MESELIFKIVLIIEFTLFSIIRVYYQRLASRAGYRTVIEESKKYSIFLSLLICYEVFTLFLYLLYPESIAWATILMPLWLQWIGVLIGISALILFMWVHRNLHPNFSIKLRITDKHTLIETGPYRLIRHPMYTAFYILHIATFFLTANWFIGLTWTAGLSVIVFLRVKREEAMMIEKFGTEYIHYMGRTGKFWPLLRVNKAANRDY